MGVDLLHTHSVSCAQYSIRYFVHQNASILTRIPIPVHSINRGTENTEKIPMFFVPHRAFCKYVKRIRTLNLAIELRTFRFFCCENEALRRIYILGLLAGQASLLNSAILITIN